MAPSSMHPWPPLRCIRIRPLASSWPRDTVPPHPDRDASQNALALNRRTWRSSGPPARARATPSSHWERRDPRADDGDGGFCVALVQEVPAVELNQTVTQVEPVV